MVLKGGYEKLEENGLQHYKKLLIGIIPEIESEILTIKDLNEIKKLNVKVDR